ncbi:hypothetical protein CAC42_891 [Sphaceloma murrayae]|uniref:Beta-catenin-like protein 1 N-terminal domain-containing protein n=1 Tax=Sphaceloma murrayae TaxID=2082308 RepID=A0A2K1R2M4_9PEZI|nr:hypothetical protein CAC42_891 [Sphaceloma murrayae]
MSNIDDLFRKPNGATWSSSAKRKLEAPDANEVYKSSKHSADDDAKHGKNGQATIEDEVEDDDTEAGPELPPDEDEEVSDDEEGRFFGGGVNKETKEAMRFLDTTDGEEIVEEKTDAAWARRLATNLERKITRNSTQRAKFEGQPENFMESETELDAEVKALSILTEHADFYEDFVSAGGAGYLVGLLAHDNVDIAINVIEILAELLDDDVQVEQSQWDSLVHAILNEDLINLLVQNFDRYDEAGNENDRQGVYHSLAVLEALGSQISIAERAGTEEAFRVLLARIQVPEADLTQNKQYAAEVLQVLLQESALLRRRVISLGGVGTTLQLLAPYRRRDPEENSLEEEYVLNLFNALICLVQENVGKEAFIEEEGVELALIMLREGRLSKWEALKTLDHATVTRGQAVCEKIVEAAGLKTIFSLFKKKLDNRQTENLLDIVAAMLRFLPGESAERIRTVSKFTEKDCEKVTKLLQWRQEFAANVDKVDQQIIKERQSIPTSQQEDMADDWYLRRLDAGLVVLQTLNTIIAWLAAEDKAASRQIRIGLENVGESISDIKKALEVQLAGADETADEDFAEMLKALIEALS